MRLSSLSGEGELSRSPDSPQPKVSSTPAPLEYPPDPELVPMDEEPLPEVGEPVPEKLESPSNPARYNLC